ncbi:MAG TPA: riboflavin synthase [Gammaproteobacteria bacterium]|nr:riboflavin synthase [Gammaproteobacteria bacterium]
MFTGIVDHCGEVISLENIPSGFRIKIKSNFDEFVKGESIAVDGICLTVTDFDKNYFNCEVSPETLKLTTANKFKKNYKINLEKSLKLQDRMGGHMVMGHVDTQAELIHLDKSGDFVLMRFGKYSAEYNKYITKKGSISINGVSLTVNNIQNNSQDNYFEVMLIPHTLSRTNLADLQMGDKVNLEIDYFARYIINYLESQQK